MATNFSPCKGSYVLNQFPSNVMFGMNGFHVSASGAIQGHHGPLVNKPVYLGMCILDLSKTVMYDFHYNYIKQKYGDKAKLLLTDTDSILYEIQTDDFYDDISVDVKHRFDTSNYPPDHPPGILSGFNKKVLGMFKDEVNGKVIDEYVGLRAKMYSYKMLEGEESKKSKGVKKMLLKRVLRMKIIKSVCFRVKNSYKR